jgi:hypothetical protein
MRRAKGEFQSGIVVDYDGKTNPWSTGEFVLEISPRLGDLTSVRQGISQLWCLGDMSDDITEKPKIW